jgi:hypothetical protein
MSELKTCRVCELEDGDSALKQCEWCDNCDQWICPGCSQNYYKRGMAMIKHRKLKEQRLGYIALIVVSALSLFILSH